MAILRQKTREVEEVGMAIDESIKVCQDTESLITRLGRFDETLFASLQSENQSDVSLKKQIHLSAQKLDKFPRKNRHSQEWYEKYHQKYLDLRQQSSQQEQTEEGIQNLLEQLDKQKQKALEENFIELNTNFKNTFRSIVP